MALTVFFIPRASCFPLSPPCSAGTAADRSVLESALADVLVVRDVSAVLETWCELPPAAVSDAELEKAESAIKQAEGSGTAHGLADVAARARARCELWRAALGGDMAGFGAAFAASSALCGDALAAPPGAGASVGTGIGAGSVASAAAAVGPAAAAAAAGAGRPNRAAGKGGAVIPKAAGATAADPLSASAQQVLVTAPQPRPQASEAVLASQRATLRTLHTDFEVTFGLLTDARKREERALKEAAAAAAAAAAEEARRKEAAEAEAEAARSADGSAWRSQVPSNMELIEQSNIAFDPNAVLGRGSQSTVVYRGLYWATGRRATDVAVKRVPVTPDRARPPPPILTRCRPTHTACVSLDRC